MKVATWNVNSLKVRLPQVLAWLAGNGIDILAVQEIKQLGDAVDTAAISEAGYSVVANGQKTYNGVAFLSRKPMLDVENDIPDFDDPQRRVIAGTLNGTRIINIYAPNGQSLDSDKYQYKLGWYAALSRYVKAELARHQRVVLLGDFNVAPTDADVHDPKRWKDTILVSEPERKALGVLIELGLVELFRLFDQAPDSFSWWDYRARGFQRNAGLRIDLILGNDAVARSCRSVTIDKSARAAERPSDHAPVVLDMKTAS